MYNKHAVYRTWKCKVCGYIALTRKMLRQHYRSHSWKEKCGWSKGLTKYNNASLLKISQSLKAGLLSGKIIPSFKGKHHSQKTKDKIISTYIENRTNNKYRGNYKGIYFQYSFELAWLVWNFEHGIKTFRCDKTFQYWDSEQQKERTYYPDFELEDGTIIEIKGQMTQNVLDKQKAVLEQYSGKYVILQKNDIKHCIKYCKDKYGKDFIQKLKD